MAHTQGIESFWSMLKRAHKGTFHKLIPKHLDRYVGEFVGRHNVRDADTIDIMAAFAAGVIGKRLRYQDLVADNRLPSGAQSARQGPAATGARAAAPWRNGGHRNSKPEKTK